MTSNLKVVWWPILVIGVLIGGFGILSLLIVGISSLIHPPAQAISGSNSASNPFYSYLLLLILGSSLIFLSIYIKELN